MRPGEILRADIADMLGRGFLNLRKQYCRIRVHDGHVFLGLLFSRETKMLSCTVSLRGFRSLAKSTKKVAKASESFNPLHSRTQSFFLRQEREGRH